MPPDDVDDVIDVIEERLLTQEELSEMLTTAWKANVEFLNMLEKADEIISRKYRWLKSAAQWQDEYHKIVGRLPVSSIGYIEEEVDNGQAQN